MKTSWAVAINCTYITYMYCWMCSIHVYVVLLLCICSSKAITKTCQAKTGLARLTAACYGHATLLKVLESQVSKIPLVISRLSWIFCLSHLGTRQEMQVLPASSAKTLNCIDYQPEYHKRWTRTDCFYQKPYYVNTVNSLQSPNKVIHEQEAVIGKHGWFWSFSVGLVTIVQCTSCQLFHQLCHL